MKERTKRSDGSLGRPSAPAEPDETSGVQGDAEEPPAAVRPGEDAGEVEEPVVAPPAPPEPDYRDRWLRTEAELQNFRRRASREWEEGRRLAEESVLLEMVAVLDDLERALAALEPDHATSSWAQGIALVAQRIREFLGRQGVTVEDPLGRPFDPNFHEALLEVEAPAGTAAGTIVQVAHKGYRRGERPLRVARVVVARGTEGGAG